MKINKFLVTILFLIIFNLILFYLRSVNLFLPLVLIILLSWFVNKYLFKD
jgi:hypothetical protein